MKLRITAAAFIVLLVGASAQAGGSNQLYVIQDGAGAKPNTLVVDQSNASNSLVRGLEAESSALQEGNGNSATLRVLGDGGTIGLLQSNSAGIVGNQATVGVAGRNALATVSQIGQGNLATLNVVGPLAEGSITQNGTGNEAGLAVAGTRADGSITQIGNGNQTGLVVTGAGTSVDYTVNGNNVSNVPGGGVEVFTNGAKVSITQTTAR